MLIRIRSTLGTQRFEIEETSTLQQLKNKVAECWPTFTQFVLATKPDGSQALTKDNASLKELKLLHGDMLYLVSTGKQEETKEEVSNAPADEIQEDEIDKYLEAQDGWIKRKRDARMCQHGSHGACQFCMPIPPWEILNHEPWKTDAVKFIPFHAYIRKLQTNSGCKHPENQRCLNCKSLDPPTYKVKPCKKHPPWPEAICTECKPSACRIDSQVYRHIDNVEFESLELVDKFLQYWRETGNQRCGFLYGRYVPDEYVPLGITATVEAIYEPPQRSTREESILEPDPNDEKVDILAGYFGLRKVGFIWTDLQTEKNSTKLIQNRKELILTSKEISRMAKMQNNYLSPCKQTLSGKLGSKFVSVQVTGNAKSQIEISAFQVSDQAMSLVKDGIVTASKDPHFMKVRRSKTLYIPDVMYTSQNEYGREIVQKADPNFPLDFFIIRLRQGAPKKPNPLFKLCTFPIENRGATSPSLSLVKRQLDANPPLTVGLSDFHLLLYLSTQLKEEDMQSLAQGLLKKEETSTMKNILTTLLKQLASTPQTAPTRPTAAAATAVTQPPAPSSVAPRGQTKREQDLEAQLVAMGYNLTQAREALWATSYQGVEQAIEFLLR